MLSCLSIHELGGKKKHGGRLRMEGNVSDDFSRYATRNRIDLILNENNGTLNA